MPLLRIVIPGPVFVYLMIGLLVISLLFAGVLFFLKVLPAIKAKRTVQKRYYMLIGVAILLAILSIIVIW